MKPESVNRGNASSSAWKASVSMVAMAVAVTAAPALAQNVPSNQQPTESTNASTAAQATQPTVTTTPTTLDTQNREIVVTGSRISRRDYQANSPIVTVNSQLFEQSSTAAIEDNLNKLPQFVPSKTPTGINAGDIQPTATNTPGSANISLRGLGANRNLVLIDGRRATPGNATGTVDINTIPTAAIERVEIITGGASATYGADAIGGVANFILKKNFKGLELDAQNSISQRGDGYEYQVSGIMGADFDDGRGNVSLAMSVNKRDPMYQNNRPWYKDYWANPNTNGGAFFPPAPGVSVTNVTQAAFDSVFGTVTPNPGLSGYSIYANPDGTPWFGFGNGGFATGQSGGSRFNKGIDGYTYKLNAANTVGANDTFLYSQLPLERYNFLARGNYEINDWIGVFGSGMYTHTHTHTVQEGGPIVGGWSVNLPYGNAIYTGNSAIGAPSSLNPDGTTNAAYLPGGRYGLTGCPTTGGCPTYIAFPLPSAFQTLMLSRQRPAQPGEPGYNANPALNATVTGANDPVGLNYLFPTPRENDTDVDNFNMTAGLQGSIPSTDWTWEVFTNYGESSTYAIQTGVISLNRLRALFSSPNWGKGFNANSNVAGFGFGSNTATCGTGYDIFTPNQAVSADCLNAIRADLKNRSKIRQTIWEADTTGTLFDLPAGALKVAIGASYRATDFSFTNDTLTDQGVSFQDQALGIYPSGDTSGRITVREAYGELLVPVLKDTFIKELNLELGGRVSNYSTTGTSYTYKLQGDMAVVDWLRFRGGYNRAERAPNIAELYLAPQQTFAFNGLGDICSQRSTYPVNGNNADVRAVCSAVMDRTAGPGSGAAYYNVAVANQPPPGGGFAFPTLIGNPNLTPEKADTWTAGVVLQSPFSEPLLQRLRLSVDWFQIKIKHAIGNSPGATIQTCLDPALNSLVNGAAGSPSQAAAAAASFQCAGLAYQAGPFPGSPPGLGNITETFTNTGKIDISGIDGQLDWSAPVGPGSVNLNVVASYFLHYRVADLASNPLVDYNGTFGTTNAGLSGAAFEWRTLTTLGYTYGPATVSLQWQHTPSVEDSAEPLAPNPITGGPSYDLFSLNMTYSVTRDITFRMGVENLFDKAPPLTGVNTSADIALGQLPGGMFNALYYDDLGRRFYMGVKAKF